MLPMSELLEPGQVFAARYVIKRLLATGGFGAVYAAEQTETELEVALKVLWPHILKSADAVEQFKLEARIAGRVGSEHIVRILDAGVDAPTGMPFLVMELLTGGDLNQVVTEGGPLSPDVVGQYVRQVAAALDRAHGYVDRSGAATPIVHRDLKPENLFLTRRETGEPVVKILDFGIAKVLTASTQVTQSVKGTPLYMAFEQASAGRISPQTDIWALGLIAFFLLTGRAYWKSANSPDGSITQLYGEILSLPIEPPSLRARELGSATELPAAFDSWFARCVNREPSLRFETAGACGAELVAALGGVVASKEGAVFSESAFGPTAIAAPPPALVGPTPTASSDLHASPEASTTPGGGATRAVFASSVPRAANQLAEDRRRARPRIVPALAALAGLVAAVLWLARAELFHPADHLAASARDPLSGPPRTARTDSHDASAREAGVDTVTDARPTLAVPLLRVRMPDRVREGDSLAVSVSADHELRILVVYLEENGAGARLLPSKTLSDPIASPGHDLALPRLRPTLRQHGTSARERLVVYGFVDAGAFQRATNLPLGASASAYVEAIDAQLTSIPPDHWARSAVSYLIEPR